MKTALVTGGTGGIGEAICRNLAEDGYYVIINYRTAHDKASILANELKSEAVCFDVSNKNSVNNIKKIICEKYGSIDLLVNNAGVSDIGLFTHISDDSSERIIDINLKGTMNCSRSFLPEMINKKSGCIVNISSMWGQCGASCEVDYSASKAGIIGFTKALAKEVAISGIRVNCVAPGFILTDMNNSFSNEDLQLIKDDIPLGFFGKPNHVADAVSFLASDKAEYITGHILSVNGGMVI